MSSDDSLRDEPPGCELALSETTKSSITDESVAVQTDVFSALANETRYRILLLLTAAEQRVCGCELEPHLDVGQSSISQSLSKLRAAGLVTRTKEGRWRYYEATERGERLVDLVESFETDQLVTAD